jgi:putative glutamine amidotransferase
MTAAPRIAVTLARMSDRPETFRVHESYLRPLTALGLAPLGLLPGTDPEAVAQLVAGVDGVMLPGGVDVNPSRYGQRVLPTSSIDDDADELELAVVAEARRRRIPVLGICRGAQVLNVALGGTLHQHLSNEILDHKPGVPLQRTVHDLQIVPDSLLHNILGGHIGHHSIAVNSCHHQAIATVGTGLRAVAWAQDGVVEAVESEDPRWWVMAVQYHPEALGADSVHAELFAAFAKACATASASRPEARDRR